MYLLSSAGTVGFVMWKNIKTQNNMFRRKYTSISLLYKGQDKFLKAKSRSYRQRVIEM